MLAPRVDVQKIEPKITFIPKTRKIKQTKQKVRKKDSVAFAQNMQNQIFLN